MAFSEESDPAGARKCAEAYQTVMGAIDENVRRTPDERIVKEVVESIKRRVAEMDLIKTRIDARVNVKREYEYYSGKVTDLFHFCIPSLMIGLEMDFSPGDFMYFNYQYYYKSGVPNLFSHADPF